MVGADDPVVVHADRNRLGIAEGVRRGMAPRAGVVVVQSLDRIEPERAADISELMIDAPPKASLERLGGPTGESMAREIAAQHGIDVRGVCATSRRSVVP